MATRSVLGLLCLVALFATTISVNVETVYIQEGEPLTIGESHDYDSIVTSCTVEMNTHSVVQLYPSSDDHDLLKFSLTYDKCKTIIKNMTKSDSGIWKISMGLRGKPSIDHEYDVKVRQEYKQKKAYPSSSIKVYKNQTVSVHFNQKFENLEHCKIINPQSKEYDLKSNASEDLELYGGCGIKISITGDEADLTGKWTLIADLKNGTTFYAQFNVLVRNITDLNTRENTFIFKKGDSGIITFGENREDESKMCILEDPKGVKMPITSGPCDYKIPSVSEYHEGAWTAYYGVEGTEKLMKQKIIVKTYSDSDFNSSSTTTSNGKVHLLCQVLTRAINFCIFERPDGLLLHMSSGVGNENYEYYGDGIHDGERLSFLKPAVHDCGITIHKPMNTDYGSWKCLIGVYEKSDMVGKILKVAPSGKNSVIINSIPKSKDVYAKRGSPFKVKCSANEPLSYCWLRSPNGTDHSVVFEDKPKPPALKYDGHSLDLGDCTAVVENANYTDAGKWTCHMGVVNGPELETSFNVYLKETHLMADQDLVSLDKSQADLICRPLPDSEKVIESCRWVNPAGHGINIDPERRYITQTESTHCRLSFRVVNLEDDLGEWACFARFTNQEEGSARMFVVYQSSSSLTTFLTVALVISLAACIALGIFILLLYKRRVARRPIDEKIILDEKPPKYP